MSMIDIRELVFAYHTKQEPIIERFSFTLQQGEIVGLLGPSGSGKSTLLRLIAGLEIPIGGTIRISGKPVVSESLFVQPEDRGVGMVFQDYALFPHMNVTANVMFGLQKMNRADKKRRAIEMLELVQMADYAERYPHELSGGQQQRIALARALAPEPHVLLMDEPFSNLDADLKASIRTELRTILNNAKMSCLLVTHDESDAQAICDRIVHMQSDKVLVHS